jgi:hypothetical protein
LGREGTEGEGSRLQAAGTLPVAARCTASDRAAAARARRRFLLVMPAGFDEICRNNMTKSGVLLLCLPIGKVAELQDIAETDLRRCLLSISLIAR